MEQLFWYVANYSTTGDPDDDDRFPEGMRRCTPEAYPALAEYIRAFTPTVFHVVDVE